MGTIIADSSHFVAFNRSLLLRQVTVIATGFLPWCLPYSYHLKSTPWSFLPECYPRRSGWSAGLLPGLLPSVSFTDETPSWHSYGNLFPPLPPILQILLLGNKCLQCCLVPLCSSRMWLRNFCIGSRNWFPPIVKRFRLAPLSFPESSLQTEILCSLPAVGLNLPKNTLRWLAFVGFLRCYPLLAGSGSSGKRAFTRLVSSVTHLSVASLSLTSELSFIAHLMYQK